MLTLIRPLNSQLADEIEQRLVEMVTSYEVIHKEISNITYLIETGKVFKGEAIWKFLDQYQKELRGQRSIIPDWTSKRDYEF
jgi:hypothetical protein